MLRNGIKIVRRYKKAKVKGVAWIVNEPLLSSSAPLCRFSFVKNVHASVQQETRVARLVNVTPTELMHNYREAFGYLS